jgi:glycosyltransferase involved in cell wall biosynthesis
MLRESKADVAFVLPSFSGGGAERVMLILLSSLAKRFDVRLIVLNGVGPLSSLVPTSVPVIDLHKTRLRNAVFALARTLHAMRPKVIVSTMGYLNLMVIAVVRCIMLRSRLVVREANTPQSTINIAGPRWLGRTAYRYLYPRADAIICPSREIAEALAVLAPTADKLTLLPNPVDELSIREKARYPIRHPGKGRRFVMAGRLTRQKGYDLALEMMEQLRDPDAHLTILGVGEEYEALHRLVTDKGLSRNVTLAGYIADPAPYFSGADALLLTSRWEGLPNVGLEAMALGVPVIATPECGGIVELSTEVEQDAITIVPIGGAYVGAMARVVSRTSGGVAASFLPRRFSLGQVEQEFAAVLSLQ